MKVINKVLIIAGFLLTALFLSTSTTWATDITLSGSNNYAAQNNNLSTSEPNTSSSNLLKSDGADGKTVFKWCRYVSSTGDYIYESFYEDITKTVYMFLGDDYWIQQDGKDLYCYNNGGFLICPYSKECVIFRDTEGSTFLSSDNGYYDVTITKCEANNDNWTISILKTVPQIDAVPDLTYTGSPITPEPLVLAGSLNLNKGTDYEYSYTNNKECGTASVTVSFKGDYSSFGYVEKTFSIVPKETTLGALTLAQDQNGYTATLNGNYTADATPVSIPSDISVNSVTINRTFQSDVTSTIILPFSVESGKYSGGTFYEFTSVDYKNGKWEASMTEVTGKIEAHKPYLFKSSGDKLTISGGVTLEASSDQEYSVTKGYWSFNGVFKVKNWATGVKRDYFFASAAATSTEGNAVSAGDFVRIGNECGLSPFRCYLSYTGGESSLTKAEKQLPSSIEVRLIDEVSSVVEPGNPDRLNPDDPGAITTPVSEITTDSGVKVWSYNRTIYIESQPGTDYKVVDLSGRTIKNGVTRSTREEVTLSRATGIVIVKVNGKTFKINY